MRFEVAELNFINNECVVRHKMYAEFLRVTTIGDKFYLSYCCDSDETQQDETILYLVKSGEEVVAEDCYFLNDVVINNEIYGIFA